MATVAMMQQITAVPIYFLSASLLMSRFLPPIDKTNNLKAAISKTEAVKTEKQLRLRQLLGAFSSAKGRLLQLNKRQSLYEQKLLPQFHQQAEIALNAYTNDSGDFGEIVRARIDELDASIDHLGITVEQQKLHLELNYVFSKANQASKFTPATLAQQNQE